MRIGDAAAATGLTPRALRFYEEEGLLRPRRTPSGHRQYTEGDLRLLRTVRGLLEAGLTIADVRSFVHVLADDSARAPGADPGTEYCAVGRVSAERLAELDARIARLTALRERLASRLATRFASVFQS